MRFLIMGLFIVAAGGCEQNAPSENTSSSAADVDVLGMDLGSDDGSMGADGGQRLDDAGPVADGGDPVEDATVIEDSGGSNSPECELACEITLGCAVRICPAPGEEALDAACAADCAASAGFAQQVNDAGTCEAVFEIALASEGELAGLCGVRSAVEVACEALSAPLSACLSDACPNTSAFGDEGLPAVSIAACLRAYDEGIVALDALERGSSEACDEGVMSVILDRLMVRADGLLTSFCVNGATNPDEVCDPACRLIGQCLPEGTPDDRGGQFRDYGTCRYLCGAREDLSSDVWRCISTIEDCGAAFGCIMGG